MRNVCAVAVSLVACLATARPGGAHSSNYLRNPTLTLRRAICAARRTPTKRETRS